MGSATASIHRLHGVPAADSHSGAWNIPQVRRCLRCSANHRSGVRRRWFDAGKLSPGPLVTAVTIVTAPSVRLQYGPQTNLDAITEMPTWDAAPLHPRPSVHATWISLSTPRWTKC